MKKSEIINYLNERKCEVENYSREGNRLCVYVKYLSSTNLEDLNNAGLLGFIWAENNKLCLELIGDIIWD